MGATSLYPLQKLNGETKNPQRWRLKICLFSCFKSIYFLSQTVCNTSLIQWGTAVQTGHSNRILLPHLCHFSELVKKRRNTEFVSQSIFSLLEVNYFQKWLWKCILWKVIPVVLLWTKWEKLNAFIWSSSLILELMNYLF